jgi:hypothetical protein
MLMVEIFVDGLVRAGVLVLEWLLLVTAGHCCCCCRLLLADCCASARLMQEDISVCGMYRWWGHLLTLFQTGCSKVLRLVAAAGCHMVVLVGYCVYEKARCTMRLARQGEGGKGVIGEGGSGPITKLGDHPLNF